MFNDNTNELAKKYLIDELGITAEEAKDAGKNLIGFFEILYNIDKRINLEKQPT